MSTKGESFSSALHGEALFTAKRPEMQPLINHLREVAQVATTFVLIDGFGLVGSVGAGRQYRTAQPATNSRVVRTDAAPSRSYAATAPSRPAVSKLRSSCQAIHVHRQNIGVPQTTGSPSVIMIVWPAKAMPVRPDAYADCVAKVMRVVARASIELAGMKRVGGCDRPRPRLLLDHRSHAPANGRSQKTIRVRHEG